MSELNAENLENDALRAFGAVAEAINIRLTERKRIARLTRENRQKQGVDENAQVCDQCFNPVDDLRWQAIKDDPQRLCRTCVGLPSVEGKKRKR